MAREDDDVSIDILDFFEDTEIENSGVGSRFWDESGYMLGLECSAFNALPVLPEASTSHAETEREDEPAAQRLLNSREQFSLAMESSPETETSKLWILSCIIGQEELAASAIFGKYNSDDSESFISAFAIPSLNGYIFIYADWDEIPTDFVADLYTLANVFDSTYHGVIYVKKMNEFAAIPVIESCLFPERVEKGKWCRLRFPKLAGRRRLYDNEVALIVESNQRDALVLLCPLIPWDHIKEQSIWKQRNFEFVKMLFDKAHLDKDYSKRTLKDNTFESGLWLHKVPLRNVQLIHHDLVTESEFIVFASSAHPAIFADFPEILGWNFQEGDLVTYWWDENTKGSVVCVSEEGVSVVDDADDSIFHEWGWAAKKEWQVGDEVTCPDGYEGVIESIHGGSVEVWDTETRLNGIKVSRYYHANTLEGKPGLRSKPSDDSESSWKRLCPWRFMPVRVTKGPAKGYHTVIDISQGQTKSGYLVVVQSSVLNNRAIHNVDYSDVVCDRTGWPLHKVRSARGWEFEFPVGYVHPHQRRPSIPPPRKTTQFASRKFRPTAAASSTSVERRTPPPSLERHLSQRWLWDLNTCGLTFPVTVTVDDKRWKVELKVESSDEAFATKKISFVRRGVPHILHYLTEVETKPVTVKINKPFFVKSGEHKGEILARIKGSMVGFLHSIRVNIFDGTIPEPHKLMSVAIVDCCQLELDPDNAKKLEAALEELRFALL